MQTGKSLYVLNIGVHLSSPSAIPHLGTGSKHKEKTLRRIKIFRIRIFVVVVVVNLHESNHYT